MATGQKEDEPPARRSVVQSVYPPVMATCGQYISI